MSNELAKKLLEELETSDKSGKRVNTTVEGDALEVVRKYQRGKAVKEVVSELILVADEYLSEVAGQGDK